MKASFCVLYAFLGLFFAEPALALTGNELLPKCDKFLSRIEVVGDGRFKYDGSTDSAECFGFAQAIHTLAYLYVLDDSGIVEKQSILRICPPSGVTVVQMIRMFVKYAKDNPDQLNNDAVFLAMSALGQAYRCKT